MNDLLSLVSFYLSDIDLLYIPRNNNINNDNNILPLASFSPALWIFDCFLILRLFKTDLKIILKKKKKACLLCSVSETLGKVCQTAVVLYLANEACRHCDGLTYG